MTQRIGIYHEPDGASIKCEINAVDYVEIYLESNDAGNIPNSDKWLRVTYRDKYVSAIELMPDVKIIYTKEK